MKHHPQKRDGKLPWSVEKGSKAAPGLNIEIVSEDNDCEVDVDEVTQLAAIPT